MDYPQYIQSNRTARLGLNILTDVVERELGWIVRPNHQENDWGIDVYLDVVSDGFVTGKSIAVQLKSGNSYLREMDRDFWCFTGERKHLNYYLNHDIPVLVVLVDVDHEIAYWEACKVEYISSINDTSWSMPIPKRQQVNGTQKEELVKYVSKNIDYVSHFEVYWAGNAILSDGDFAFIVSGKEEIQKKNYTPLADLIKRISSNKILLSHYRERVEISIHGYEDDNRELYEIEEVQSWVKDVFFHVPGLSYFLINNDQSHFLKLFFLSNIPNAVTVRIQRGERYFISYSSETICKVLEILFHDLNSFTRRKGLGEEIACEISKHMAECLTGKSIEF